MAPLWWITVSIISMRHFSTAPGQPLAQGVVKAGALGHVA
jgi:hypothetical protein